MSAFLCQLWPYLCGGLIAWLLSGFFARRLKYAEVKEKIVKEIVEKTVEVENPLHIQRIAELEGQVEEVSTFKSRIAELEALQLSSAVIAIDLIAAKAAGLKISDDTDFTVIEGIGPKISGLIHAAGINSFHQLSQTPISFIQNILDDAGANFALAKPDTWPKQSEMVANNRWQELKVWQDELDGGV